LYSEFNWLHNAPCSVSEAVKRLWSRCHSCQKLSANRSLSGARLVQL